MRARKVRHTLQNPVKSAIATPKVSENLQSYWMGGLWSDGGKDLEGTPTECALDCAEEVRNILETAAATKDTGQTVKIELTFQMINKIKVERMV